MKILRDEYGHGYYAGVFECGSETRHGVYKSKAKAGTTRNTSDAETQARDYWEQEYKLVSREAITSNPASFGDLLFNSKRLKGPLFLRLRFEDISST